MTTQARKRLSTEARRAQLLDATHELILEHGLNSFTMELLARKAGVSNPLIYKYFSTRLDLLQSLLVREFNLFYGSLRKRLDSAGDFVDIVRIFVGINFDEHSNGKILPILLSLSDVAKVIANEGQQRQREVAKILVDNIVNHYDVSRKDARFMAKMASGASTAAAEHFSQRGGNRKRTIESAVEFILGAMETYKK